MSRVSPDDVRAIIDFDPAVTNLQPFIDAAEELVNEVCASTAYYTEARLKIIETWLAAHFLAIRDPRYQSEGIGAANATVMAQVGFNLALTPFGQQAALLDSKGGLAWLDKHISQGKRAKVSITWLGTCKPASPNYRFYSLPA